MNISEIVYQGRNNTFSLTVKQDGVGVDWSAATNFELNVAGITVSSGISGDSLGEITFDIQSENIPIGTHVAELIVFDPSHPLGQVVFDENSERKIHIKFV